MQKCHCMGENIDQEVSESRTRKYRIAKLWNPINCLEENLVAVLAKTFRFPWTHWVRDCMMFTGFISERPVIKITQQYGRFVAIFILLQSIDMVVKNLGVLSEILVDQKPKPSSSSCYTFVVRYLKNVRSYFVVSDYNPWLKSIIIIILRFYHFEWKL